MCFWKNAPLVMLRLASLVVVSLLPAFARAEIYYPSAELSFSSELQVVETGERLAFNADPSGGTPRTAGQVNLALAAGGGVGFESSRIAASYGDDKLTNGVYGVGTPDNDDATRPWIALDTDASGFAGVKLAAASTIRAMGFGSRFGSRSNGRFTLQVTSDDFTGVDLEVPAQVAALSWTTVGWLDSSTADEFGRHLVAFAEVASVTGVRIVVSEGGTTITEIEVYADITSPPEPDPPAEPTAYTTAVLADVPIHYYRFEETHALQPAKDAVGPAPDGSRPGTFQGGITLGGSSAVANLGSAASFDGTSGTLVDLGVPFHTGSELSVEAWVRLDPAASISFHPIVARWDGSYELDVSEASGEGNFVTRNTSGTLAVAETAGAFTKGEWHHIVGIFSAGETTVYLDGVPGSIVDTSATGTGLQDAGATLFIGSTRDGTQFHWKGLIDEVAFYDYALTQIQIDAHIAAASLCVEEPDTVSISGPAAGQVGKPVELTATLGGIDPGGSPSFGWEVVAGVGAVSPADAAVVSVTAAEPGAVTVRVSASDGVCSDLATAEHTVTFVDPRAEPTIYSAAVLADGPLHYYRMEETSLLDPARDAVGLPPDGDHPGTYQGGLTLGQPSAFTDLGRALLLDGAPGTLVSLGAPFHPGPVLSVEAWVNLDPTAAVAFHPIVARWDGSYELDVNEAAGKASFVTRNGAGELAIAETTAALTKGEWHHIVGIFSAGQTTLYMDGVQGTLVDTSATGTDLQDLGETLLIGSTRDGTQYNWKGLIDEVAFYGYALSQDQVYRHLLAARGCIEDPDAVSISGPDAGEAGGAVELTAVLDGIDPGASASFSWAVVAGSATVAPADAALVSVASGVPGIVTVRVSANDGVCDMLSTAEWTITFVDPRGEPTAYTAAVLADGPIHYYRFEDASSLFPARDSVGLPPDGDHPGTYEGNTSLGQPSAFEVLGSAVFLDGSLGTLVNLGTPFHPGPTLSVEAWVNLDPAASVSFHPVVARWDGSYELDVSGGTSKASFVTRNSSGELAVAETADALAKGSWHHVVGVFSGGVTTVYLDGVQGTIVDASATGTDLRDAGESLFMGASHAATPYTWRGLIDEVAFYNYALTQDQIKLHVLAAQGCSEDLDSVSISGPSVASAGTSVELTATLDGIDPEGTASFSWELLAGSATVTPADAAVVGVTAAGPGVVTVRVLANDGICDTVVAAKWSITFVDPRVEPTAYTAAVLADGPIHYYRFEETSPLEPARDAVGLPPDGNHPGTYQGNVTLGQASASSAMGAALYLDGTSGTLVNLGAPFHLGPTLSVEAWVNLDLTAGLAFYPIAARWEGSHALQVDGETGRAAFVTRNDAGELAEAETGGAFTKGEWHHVVGVFSMGQTTVYLDGVRGTLVDTSGTGTGLQDAGTTLFLGASLDGATSVWKGLIDEVAFYDRALSAAEIGAHLDAASQLFHRGDANVDGRVDIADSIFLLGYLFRGTAKPRCMESANANDAGAIDIADPIYLINHLFRGGPAMPAPGGVNFPCGPDPATSPTHLGCRSYDYCDG